MTNLVRKISDIKYALGGELDLPIYGFRNPEFHVMGLMPSFKDMVKATSFMDDMGAVIGLAKAGNALQNLTDPEYVATGLINSHIPPQVLFYWNLVKLSGLWTFTVPRYNFLRSYHFFGVQPMRQKGFTYHVDAKINTEEGSMMRHVITPYEYIMYNAPVHSCTEGEVVEVVMDRQDDIHTNRNLNFGTVKVEEHLGNMIRIRVNKVIDITYAGLARNSSRLRVGDVVAKGDTIARVGCSAWSRIPFLYLQFAYVGPRIPIAGNLQTGFSTEKVEFCSHMQCDLIDLRRLGSINSTGKDPYTIFTHVDPMAIKYNPGVKTLSQCCLIKKFPYIVSP